MSASDQMPWDQIAVARAVAKAVRAAERHGVVLAMDSGKHIYAVSVEEALALRGEDGEGPVDLDAMNRYHVGSVL